MSPIIVIPARSGSKRLPGKNLLEIGGKSLVRRCAETAVATRLGQIYVNSDSADILAEGTAAGAIPCMRAEELSGDTVSSQAVVADMALWFGWKAEQPIILMQCTSPLTSKDSVLMLWRMYVLEKHPIAISNPDREKPSGGAYVFPVKIMQEPNMFSLPWKYQAMYPDYLVDIDTHDDFTKAKRIMAEMGMP